MACQMTCTNPRLDPHGTRSTRSGKYNLPGPLDIPIARLAAQELPRSCFWKHPRWTHLSRGDGLALALLVGVAHPALGGLGGAAALGANAEGALAALNASTAGSEGDRGRKGGDGVHGARVNGVEDEKLKSGRGAEEC